jgi:DNA-binding CsgD family transcriptional regulator
MSSPAPDLRSDVPPAAREFVAALTAAPTAPVKTLVSGGIGTGKSAVLAAVRTALREAGRVVLSRPPRAGDPADAALVVDDAHLLDDGELAVLAERVADPAATVVVAGEARLRHPGFRALSTALARENPVVALGPLEPAEMARVAAARGASPQPVRSLREATGGLPFLVRATLGADEGGLRRAAAVALTERLGRIDGPVLDTLLVLTLSPGLGPDDVAAALAVGQEAGLDLVDAARATGLLDPAHPTVFLRSVHHGVAQLTGAARHHEVEIALLRSQLEMSTLTAELALQLAEHGLRDERLAEALTDHAGRVRARPADAARLYRAAAQAGATALDARLADALALTGDCATAGRLADELLSSGGAAERAAGVRIAASIAMHDGSAAQAADLFRWLGPYPDAVVSSAGVVAAIGAGDAATARAALTDGSAGPPTSTARASRSLAEGLLLSLDQPFAVAVARLSQAITAEAGSPVVAPDTPAALVTLAALHGGDPVRARSVISRAARVGDGAESGEIFVTHRHRLLLGWVRMQDGQLGAATAAVAATVTAPLHRRDALWAAALQTAVARRSGDSGAMHKHWYAAMEVLAEYSIDLFALLPLGELWVAAARMRQLDRLAHPLAEAFALLESLGDPVLWAMPLHWAGVHAGILASAPDAVAPHGQALTAAAGGSSFAKALATAGRTWLRVLANHVDTGEVTAAARALSQFGLTWDATRLAGQAALQTPDGRVSQAMLQLARDLKQSVAGADPDPSVVPAAVEPTGRSQAPSQARLSDREREVAELLLLGMPYRDIGAQLFISAKTVEHHVARIRRRLGAESRSEMLSMLRALLSGEG